jgi:hypothetical protein
MKKTISLLMILAVVLCAVFAVGWQNSWEIEKDYNTSTAYTLGTIGMQIKVATTFANVTGETSTIAVQAPVNAILLGGAVRADTTVTTMTGTTWSASVGAAGKSLIGTGLALTKNTKATITFDNLSTMRTLAATDIIVYPDSGVFTKPTRITGWLYYWAPVTPADY